MLIRSCRAVTARKNETHHAVLAQLPCGYASWTTDETVEKHNNMDSRWVSLFSRWVFSVFIDVGPLQSTNKPVISTYGE